MSMRKLPRQQQEEPAHAGRGWAVCRRGLGFVGRGWAVVRHTSFAAANTAFTTTKCSSQLVLKVDRIDRHFARSIALGT